MKRTLLIPTAFALLAAACGGTTATTAAPTTTQAASATTAASVTPPTGPSDIAFSPQESDGSAIVVDSVNLPAPGFIAVHADADGKPGPIVGHSELLPAGTSTNVTVTLDSPLTGSAKLFPMVHMDMNGNGEYEFFPPDDAVDVPGTFADGSIAVVGAEVTVTDGEAAATTLTTSTTDLGTFLVDGDGNTLYVFLPDNQGDSTCYDACADNWPALVGDVTAGAGVDATLLGTTTRRGGAYQQGAVQVTYNGWPLYSFAGDAAPGDTNGQGVKDVWYVVDPAGDPIK